MYEWGALRQEKMDGDVGDTSIEGCLISALGAYPDEGNLVEIRYRGLHMGTFDIRRVDDSPGEIAAIISETYGLLMHDN